MKCGLRILIWAQNTQNDPFGLFEGGTENCNPHLDTLGAILDPGKAIFGHFIDFGHFPIEIPIEAEKFYGQQKEGSYIKNKTCFENRRPNGTT